ncbi:hypothetical protein Aab01nite_71610 [Paractinoplanes abujensis]|uniref:Uncharacterized protein n=1 Tax=Paractinoplanes abujensis TaxID=882441 RepID=A0A7W7CUB6_9ACTN|nr:hypothetical protein [Actinoplanes abujensis]MBB4694842.1 hypothetical protein [Actinoplanes abujensis]GID23571.1 hypothetical protein Aab01nite_71610 [Actinoplanes abujensis]
MLLKEIRAIAGETLVLAPHDQDTETANTSWFGAPPHERMGLSAEEVVTAFEETAVRLRDQVAEAGHAGPATFYVWHDLQAGQLRCSTASCRGDELPFAEKYRTTEDLRAIVVEFLEDRAPGAIVWGEFDPVPIPDGPDAGSLEIPVWVCDLCP